MKNIRLIEFSPEEANDLTFLVCHPNSSRVSEILSELHGSAYEVGRILVYGVSEKDLPGYISIAEAYRDWRDNIQSNSYSGPRARNH